MDSNFTCMFQMMIPINSVSLVKFGNFEKMWKFHNFSIAGTVGIFSCKILTCPNGLKFHMHVSDVVNNKFCKFDDIW